MGKDRKVVFFDIDGTLLNDKMELPRSTKEAIFNLKENGVYVAIATGRSPFMFEQLRKELEIESYISVNGSYVVVEGEVISRIPLETEKLVRLEQATMEAKHGMVFLDHEGIVANCESNPFISTSLGELGLSYPPVKRGGYYDRPIYQALIFCEEYEEDYLKEHDYFKYIRWHRYALDILPSGGSKAHGVKKVLEHLSLDLKNTYAFGDGFNDIEMLQFVGTGVAMANGREVTKAAADHVTKHVDDDGIYHGLKSLGLIG